MRTGPGIRRLEEDGLEMLEAVELGRRVRSRRLALGMKSQAALAERAQISPSYISRLESGQAGDKVEELIKVAQALGWKLSQLVGESDEEFAAEVRRRMPDGSELAISFERLARNVAAQTEAEQAFVKGFIDHLADRYGVGGSEAPKEP
jgi:transcriptional regulator with XRE-family HTH domain